MTCAEDGGRGGQPVARLPYIIKDYNAAGGKRRRGGQRAFGKWKEWTKSTWRTQCTNGGEAGGPLRPLPRNCPPGQELKFAQIQHLRASRHGLPWRSGKGSKGVAHERGVGAFSYCSTSPAI